MERSSCWCWERLGPFASLLTLQSRSAAVERPDCDSSSQRMRFESNSEAAALVEEGGEALASARMSAPLNFICS